MSGTAQPADLRIYRVEHRGSTFEDWESHDPPVAGWPRAVARLRSVLDDALAGVDDEPDDIARDCIDVLHQIEQGRLAAAPELGYMVARYTRIALAAPTLRDRVAAWMRYLVVTDCDGRGPVTIRTRSGQHLRGDVDWLGFDAGTVAVQGDHHRIVLRTTEIESFTLDDTQPPGDADVA